MSNPAPDFSADFSDRSFWQKLAKAALSAGRELVRLALQLFYAWREEETPLWAKATIVAALGYFISPLDLIPDAIPVVGYSDDLAVLLGAVEAVATHITPEIKARAEETLGRWFG